MGLAMGCAGGKKRPKETRSVNDESSDTVQLDHESRLPGFVSGLEKAPPKEAPSDPNGPDSEADLSTPLLEPEKVQKSRRRLQPREPPTMIPPKMPSILKPKVPPVRGGPAGRDQNKVPPVREGSPGGDRGKAPPKREGLQGSPGRDPDRNTQPQPQDEQKRSTLLTSSQCGSIVVSHPPGVELNSDAGGGHTLILHSRHDGLGQDIDIMESRRVVSSEPVRERYEGSLKELDTMRKAGVVSDGVGTTPLPKRRSRTTRTGNDRLDTVPAPPHGSGGSRERRGAEVKTILNRGGDTSPRRRSTVTPRKRRTEGGQNGATPAAVPAAPAGWQYSASPAAMGFESGAPDHLAQRAEKGDVRIARAAGCYIGKRAIQLSIENLRDTSVSVSVPMGTLIFNPEAARANLIVMIDRVLDLAPKQSVDLELGGFCGNSNLACPQPFGTGMEVMNMVAPRSVCISQVAIWMWTDKFEEPLPFRDPPPNFIACKDDKELLAERFPNEVDLLSWTDSPAGGSEAPPEEAPNAGPVTRLSESSVLPLPKPKKR